MATARRADAQDVGRAFAQEAKAVTEIYGVWVQQRPSVFELWVATPAIDGKTERELQALSARLYEWLPQTNIEFHVISKRHFEPFILEQIIPKTAKPAYLR